MSPDLNVLIECAECGDQWEQEEGALDQLLACMLPAVQQFSATTHSLVLYQLSSSTTQQLASTGQNASNHQHLHSPDLTKQLSHTPNTFLNIATLPDAFLVLPGPSADHFLIECVGAGTIDAATLDQASVKLISTLLVGYFRRYFSRQSNQSDETIQQKIDQFRYLAEYGTVVQTTSDEPELLMFTMPYLMEMLDADYVDVALYKTEKNGLVEVATQIEEEYSEQDSAEATVITAADSVVQAVWQQRNPLEIEDMATSELKHHRRDDLVALVALPIEGQDKIYGVIEIARTSQRSQPLDATLALPIITQLALALNNLESIAQSQRLAQREAKVNQMIQRIQGTTNPERLLSEVAQGLREMLNAQRVAIRLGIPDDSQNGGQS